MSLDAAQILQFYKKDRDAKSRVLDERIPDLKFARWKQTDDQLNDICTTEFRGEYNIISRERKRIQSEFRKNEIEVKFRNKDTDNDSMDDIVQGKYRTDRRLSKSKQCFQIAQDDAIDCGFGAWRLVTENEDDLDTLSTNLEVRRVSIPEAIRRVFFDCNAVLMDKSDASRCSVISEFDEHGYKSFIKENDIKDSDNTVQSFDMPYRSIFEDRFGTDIAITMFSEGEGKIYVLEFYNLEPVKNTYYMHLDANTGEPFTLLKADSIKQELGDPIRKKTITIHKCFKYLHNGLEILKRSEVPGGHIPVIPTYGERNFVDGVENFYGIVKAARDPQVLTNASLNYLASMMMNSPIPKPEFDPMEIEGLNGEFLGSTDFSLKYYMRNKSYHDEKTGQTHQFPMPTYTQPPTVPTSVSQLVATLPSLTDSILNPGVTADALDAGASGVAIQEVREEIGLMSYIYLDHWGESMRRDGEVYGHMLAAVSDVERTFVVTNTDGTTTTETVNEETIEFNPEAVMTGGELITKGMNNKLEGERFDVAFDIGPSYQSKRDSALANLKELYLGIDPNDPMKQVMLLNIMSKQSGEGMDEVNKAARYKLLMMQIPGFEPQTDDEEEFMQQMLQQQQQQQGQPDPMMLAAMAEQQKAEAQQMDAQTKQFSAQSKSSNDQAKIQVESFKAQTDRMSAQIDAQETGATINNKEMDTMNKAVDAQLKQADLAEKQLQNQLKSMGTDELINLMNGGA